MPLITTATAIHTLHIGTINVTIRQFLALREKRKIE